MELRGTTDMANTNPDYFRFKMVEAKLKERGFTIDAHGASREDGIVASDDADIKVIVYLDSLDYELYYDIEYSILKLTTGRVADFLSVTDFVKNKKQLMLAVCNREEQ